MTPPDHVGDDPVPHAGGGSQGLSTARLTGLLNGTYVRGQVRSAAGVLDPTRQAIIVLDANGDIDDIQIAAVI